VKVIIVGGGVIGCSIAYHLQTSGASVLLLERGGIGSGASGAAAGMLIAPIEDTGNPGFNELRRASLEMYPELITRVQEASGISVAYKTPGMLRVATTPGMAEVLREAADIHAELVWLDAADARRMEPALAADTLGAAFSEGDADLDPGLWTKALASAAEDAGADVRAGVTVQSLAHGGVRTDQGDFHGDAVVVAAGPWTESLTGIESPPMRGQMISYRSDALHHAIWGEDGYLLPKPGGFVWAGATVEDAGFAKETTEGGIAHLKGMAERLVPRLADCPVAYAWAGLRPGSSDGLPVIGRLPDTEKAYVASGHFRNGILLAPITGALMAELVLEGRLDERLVPFSPGRFEKV
jgi:glycine oxidase